MKGKLVLTIVLPLLVAILAGLTGSTVSANDATTLVIGLSADPKSLGPTATDNDACVSFHVYSAITQSDKNFGPAPDLAKSWEVSEDSLTYTFHLNPAAKFHDGTPVTSEDGKLIGVVSSTDIVIHDTQPASELPSGEPHDYYLQALERRYTSEDFASSHIAGEPVVTVRDIMTPVIYKVSEDTSVQQVADTMIKNRIHRVFVTRGEQVVGIIATPEMLQVVRGL